MKSHIKITTLILLMLGLAGLQFCTPEARNQQQTNQKMTETEPDTIDRTARPEPGPAPEIRLPEPEKASLDNGLDIVLVTQSEVPMVIMDLVIHNGSAADPVDAPGLADFTAAMLDEGTENRTALDISEGIDFYGARLSTGSNWDYSHVKLTTLTKHLDSTMMVFTDVIRNSTFPKEDFERVREERLNSLLQKKDQPSTIATEAFYKVIYTKGHPYGTPDEGTEESLNEFTPEDLRQFRDDYYRPNNATLFVAGDITMEELLPRVRAAFGDWKPGDTDFPTVPEIPSAEYSNIYLVDKEGAPQSQIRIGHPGLHRDNPDYAAVQVMNEILGGSFGSRINMNLREDKGFTYGARSAFVYRRGVGPFLAYAGVKTSTTDSSVKEFLKEIRTIVEEPVSDEELDRAKSSMTLSLARETETLNQILDLQIDQVVYDLPEDHLSAYVSKVRNMTKTEVQQAAREYLHPNKLAIVVVGDKDSVRSGLEKLDYGEVLELDLSGELVE
ncbi:MAG: insulinase family protein [Candidatus Marinimicrobia bacterium]|nr:insulinase family protein [Candidatus Neomarinimicrobiota bacterium]MCF7828694.1 insulinase family protein [Candidatus Neomarinimicrobiota bacterium]MCF7880435.1 insulinase family protein [Candidatus Neomarinimicrobiota bacterium]